MTHEEKRYAFYRTRLYRTAPREPEWNANSLKDLFAPLGWRGQLQITLVGDLFALRTYEQIAAVFGVMASTPRHQ